MNDFSGTCKVCGRGFVHSPSRHVCVRDVGALQGRRRHPAGPSGSPRVLSAPDPPTTCADCGGKLAIDTGREELYCLSCGLVRIDP